MKRVVILTDENGKVLSKTVTDLLPDDLPEPRKLPTGKQVAVGVATFVGAVVWALATMNGKE